MAGRLAFFDPYCLHWTSGDMSVDAVLQETLRLRRHYLPLLSNLRNFVKQDDALHHGNLTMLCYHDSSHAERTRCRGKSLPYGGTVIQACAGAPCGDACRRRSRNRVMMHRALTGGRCLRPTKSCSGRVKFSSSKSEHNGGCNERTSAQSSLFLHGVWAARETAH